jgi:hypothetical protein
MEIMKPSSICYCQRSARAIVMALIIDDGVRGRRHRRNIFNPQVRRCWSGVPVYVPGPMLRIRLTPRHQLSVVVALTPRFFENRLNGWIDLKQCVA